MKMENMKRITLTDEFNVSKFVTSLNPTIHFEEISESDAKELLEDAEIINAIENPQKELFLSIRFLRRLENCKKYPTQHIDGIILAEFTAPHWNLTLTCCVETKVTWWRITYV